MAESRFVALLRGVNVGGKNPLPMKALAALFAEAGCGDVSTYIQSGNVLFQASPSVANRLPKEMPGMIEERFGFAVPVVIRSAPELADAVERNPFVREGAELGALHVAFLTDAPAPAAAASLDPDRSPPDRFVVDGREIYLHCPSGLGRSKLTNGYFDSKLRTTSTLRNWRTVLTLLDLASVG